MKVVIAPDSFKESMTTHEVARAMERGIRNVCNKCTIVKVPLADGGEGTANILINRFKAKMFNAEVTGPFGEKIVVEYGIANGEVAIMDVASVVGLHHIPPKRRNPLKATSYGVGELIYHALQQGVSKFIIGLGGSATNDGGIGMAQALGVKVLDEEGRNVPLGGAGLERIKTINISQMDKRLRHCTFTIISDVNNVLLGREGATYVYGKQKGANDDMLQQLERAMVNYSSVLKKDVKVDVAYLPGAGAAGGLGAAFVAFLQAEIKRGIDYIIEVMNLEKEIETASYVLTGEGKIDDQTLHGKAVTGVATLAKKYDIPVIAIVGSSNVTYKHIYETGIKAIFPIVNKPMSLNDAMNCAEYLTEKTVENVFRLLLLKN